MSGIDYPYRVLLEEAVHIEESTGVHVDVTPVPANWFVKYFWLQRFRISSPHGLATRRFPSGQVYLQGLHDGLTNAIILTQRTLVNTRLRDEVFT